MIIHFIIILWSQAILWSLKNVEINIFRIIEHMEYSKNFNAFVFWKRVKRNNICVHSEKILEIIAFYKNSKNSTYKDGWGVSVMLSAISDATTYLSFNILYVALHTHLHYNIWHTNVNLLRSIGRNFKSVPAQMPNFYWIWFI